jgi:hypothetical protein
VIARQLASQLVHEPRFVRLDRRQRHREDQVGDVVGAILSDREQQQADHPTRVVVEPPEEAEVDQREAPLGHQEHVAPMRVVWYTPSTVT